MANHEAEIIILLLLSIIFIAIATAAWRAVSFQKPSDRFSLDGTGYIMDGGTLFLVDVEKAMKERKDLIDEINALAIPMGEIEINPLD